MNQESQFPLATSPSLCISKYRCVWTWGIPATWSVLSRNMMIHQWILEYPIFTQTILNQSWKSGQHKFNRIYLCLNVCIYIYMCMHALLACMYACMHVCAYTYVYSSVYAYIYICVCTVFIYIWKHTHVYIYILFTINYIYIHMI